MAVVPTIESVFLEVLQALDLDDLQTQKKKKFKKHQMSLAKHQRLIVEVFNDICRQLELDLQAKDDLVFSLNEAAAFHSELENSVWTFGADQRQVLWYVLGYSWMPFLGRKIAFWQMDERMDADMPGSEFWYLPRIHQKNGKSELRMPVANVLDWLFELSGLSMDRMSSCLGGGYDEETKKDEESAYGIESNLYNWLDGTLPRAVNIDSMFRNECEIPFNGTFKVDERLSLNDKLKAARRFIKRKDLTPDDLRGEIPMISPGAIEAVLAGETNEEVTTIFIDLLARRYAVPSMQNIRNRLHLARAVQHGYRKLLDIVCPGVKDTCTDFSQNKVLQLLNIYKYIYNMTIKAHGEGATQEEEDSWFESHLIPWCKTGIFYSILPSSNLRSKETAQSVGTTLSERFMEFLGGEKLENLFGWNEQSTAEIAKREILRLKEEVECIDESKRLKQKIRYGSPWRTLQSFEDYHVIRSLLQDETLPMRTRKLVHDRLREVAVSPIQEVNVILGELDDHLNNEKIRRVKNCCELVEGHIAEMESHSAVEIFRLELLRHKAKHSLFQNDFKSAEVFLRQALETSIDRNRGRQLGEIARDLFALSVATQGLIPNNHEKYYRHALFTGMFEGGDPSAFSIQEAAIVATNYFWDDLYRTYPGVSTHRKP